MPNINYQGDANIVLYSSNVEPYKYLITSLELIEEITFQSNVYSTQKKVASINVSSNEMLDFSGKTILMRIIHLPSTRDYCREDGQVGKIEQCIPRNRY